MLINKETGLGWENLGILTALNVGADVNLASPETMHFVGKLHATSYTEWSKEHCSRGKRNS